MKAIKVHLREKKISKGRKSLYLDFYPSVRHPESGKETRREFLGLYIYEKPQSPFETQHNKSTRALAESIRNRRYIEIQEGIYGLQSDSKRRKSFIEFFEQMTKSRYTSEGNYGNWLSAQHYLKECFEHGLTMGELSMNTVEEFRNYILRLELAQNTKHSYFNKFRAAIKEAFKKGYIPENYAKKVNTIKAEETTREFLTLEELKMLSKTECPNPLLKRVFLFSALTGLRFSDIKALTWGQVQGNPENGFFI
ncbi:MAG: site-specific integrase, partial [Bacteroidota bacterium]